VVTGFPLDRPPKHPRPLPPDSIALMESRSNLDLASPAAVRPPDPYGCRLQAADPPLLGAEDQAAINIPSQVVTKPFLHLNGAGAITSKQAVMVGSSATKPQVCNQVLPNLFNFLVRLPGLPYRNS
jgi:hypothetical protein